tara:strand:+ start:252 stop:854 length:603 start_codon:yes stop_codon:yes gene_type:complete
MKYIYIILVIIPLLGFSQNIESIALNTMMPLQFEKMKATNNEYYSLKQLKKDNGIVIIFTSNTCPFVVMWEDRYKLIEKLCNDYNIGLVYVNSNYQKRAGDDSFTKMQIHATNMDYQYPYIIDTKSKLANTFHAKTTPHIFIFNNKDLLVYKGSIDDNYKDIDSVTSFYVKEVIIALSNNDTIKIDKTKAIGCSIKRFVD